MLNKKKEETSYTVFQTFQLKDNNFRYCYVFLSFVRHQTTKGTNLFFISINIQRCIAFKLETPRTMKNALCACAGT